MTYDEVQFLKAEHYLRTGKDANAKAAYEAGIAASMSRWGLADGGTVIPHGASPVTSPSVQLPTL